MPRRQNIVSLSEAASLAMHALALLARNPGQRFKTQTIAHSLGASTHHLAKLVQRLATHGLVECTVGPGGGVRLAAHATEASLLDIYQAVEGPLEERRCMLNRPACDGPHQQGCILGGVLESVNQQIREVFSQRTLADLADSVEMIELPLG